MEYLLQGIRQGFWLGFGHGEVQLRSVSRNMQSAEDNAEVVEQYLVKECGLGRVIGPLALDDSVHVSRFGVIPEPHQPGK